MDEHPVRAGGEEKTRQVGQSLSGFAGLKAAINGGPAPCGQMRWTQRCQNRCGEPPFLQ
jgi:hypothetical protein